MTEKIVVSIPIALKNRKEIASALLDKYELDYVFLGRVFQNRTSLEFCLIDIADVWDYKLKNRGDWVNLPIFNSNAPIKNRELPRQIVYLTSENIGYDACLKMARFARVFLNIGGIEVKVNSSGMVIKKDKWLENYNSQDVFAIYSLFVTLVEGDSCYYSCGMKNFGLADVSVNNTENTELAIYVLNVFNYYRLTDSVILKDGETFQPDLECPVYRMHWSKSKTSETYSMLYNSWGKWHLNRVSEEFDISYQIN